jgi:hypothetical protein
MATTNPAGSAGTPQPNQAQPNSNATLAGATTAFTRLGEVFPQIASMQDALVNGTVRSQRREAERLTKVYGNDDPRVVRAAARVQSLAVLQTEVMANAHRVSQFVTSTQRPGTFHGYVIQSDGTVATGYTVRVEVRDPAQKATRRGKGKTDANGYFNFAVSGAAQAPGQQTTALDRIIERTRLTGAPQSPLSPAAETPRAAPAPDAAPDKSTPAKSDSANVVSKAEVLDTAGTVVLSDPLPPTFDTLTSEFRLYTLDAANKPATTDTAKPTSKQRAT